MRDEWEKVTLGDVAFITDGDHLPPPKTDYGIPFIYISNIEGFNKINFTDCSYVPEDYYEKIIDKRKVKENDILYTVVGSYGIPVLVKSETKFCFQRHIALIRAEKINSEFLVQVLDSGAFRLQADKVAIGEAQKTVTLDNLRKMRINLPPLSDQLKIAETLSVWDSAIEKTEKLISDKERMFSFLMKKILSKKGNTCYLNKIVIIKKGNQLNKENMISNGTVPVLNGGISYSGFTNFANTQKNTIAISEGGNSCGYVNFVSEDFWAGGHCYTLELKDKDVETKFLYWMLKSKEKEIMKLRVGSGLPNIQQNDLCNLKIEIYNKNDQLKIIELLDCQQREISLLKKQLEQYKLQKQGLMQKLLTGEWRIK